VAESLYCSIPFNSSTAVQDFFLTMKMQCFNGKHLYCSQVNIYQILSKSGMRIYFYAISKVVQLVTPFKEKKHTQKLKLYH